MFKHWSFNPTRSTYTGTFEIAHRLPSGLYNVAMNNYGEPVASKLGLRNDSMMAFEHGPLHNVLAEIDHFWKSGQHYKKLGVSHKRGILLHGPAGCGKTGIISVVIQNTIDRDGIVFQVNDIEYFQHGFVLARQIEAGRPIVAVIEDIERIVERDEETLLEVMDGASSLGDGILFVATTNYLKKIPPRVRCRPSRIDTLMEIGFPDVKQRHEYLKFLLNNDGENSKLAALLAEQTVDFSLAALKELVISIQVYGKPVKQAIATLREMTNDVVETKDE